MAPSHRTLRPPEQRFYRYTHARWLTFRKSFIVYRSLIFQLLVRVSQGPQGFKGGCFVILLAERTALRKGSGVSVLEPYTLNMRSLSARVITGLFLAVTMLAMTSCRAPLYYTPEYNYAGRPIPPSKLLQRVLAAYSNNGSTGGLEILDGNRDLRNNVQNTIPSFSISGFSASNPGTIISYPEQTTGYVLSTSGGTLSAVNYSTEASSGTVASFGAYTAAAAAAVDGSRFVGAAQTAGQLVVVSGGVSYVLNLPNVYRVAVNQGNSVILATVRNSNSLYRVIKLPASSNPIRPPGYVDCEPLLLPVYCVVPVAGTYDRPQNVSFSLDGNSAYVLNCGPECGGTRASVSVLQQGALQVDNIPTVDPLSASAPSPLASLSVANPIPVPGGVTAALSDGNNLYLSGQSLFSLGAERRARYPTASGWILYRLPFGDQSEHLCCLESDLHLGWHPHAHDLRG